MFNYVSFCHLTLASNSYLKQTWKFENCSQLSPYQTAQLSYTAVTIINHPKPQTITIPQVLSTGGEKKYRNQCTA